MIPRRLAFLMLLLAGLFVSGPAVAHKISPAIVTVTFDNAGAYEITVATNLEAVLADIGPQHEDTDSAPTATLYKELRDLPPEVLRERFEVFFPRWIGAIRVQFDETPVQPRLVDITVSPVGDTALARTSRVRMAGVVPEGAQTVRWRYPRRYGSSILRVKFAGSDAMVTAWLDNGKESDPVPLAGVAGRSTAGLFMDYVVLGFTHILPGGLDHILFVLGLFLLNTRLRPLLIQVTAFTLAHSITLALGLYGVVRVAPSIVEPLIAASIVYVAVENVFTSRLHVWRPAIVFGFGLLHGLGFAGVLLEIGLPRGEFVTGLIAFNLGVEFGQLGVIALAWGLVGLWFSAQPWYRARIVQPASLAIALVGLYWTVERVLAGWGA